jgi:hypothetical protein
VRRATFSTVKLMGTADSWSTASNGMQSNVLRINRGNMGQNRSTNGFSGLANWHDEVIAISELLFRALMIQIDLFRRLSRRPLDKVLLAEQKRYDKLVWRLLLEYKTALTYYQLALRQIIKR